MDDVLQEIKAERERQQIIEGFDNKHDDDHDAGELAGAGAAYALNASCVLYPANGTPIEDPRMVGWCWDMAWWKPKDPGETFVAIMDGVIERNEGRPAELWLRDGKAVIRAYNEAGYNSTEIYLDSLLSWLSKGKAENEPARKSID